MVHVRSCIEIKKDKDEVYDFIKNNFKSFPYFMKNIKKLKVIRKSSNLYITSWQVEIDGNLVAWKEEDRFDKEKLKISFKLMSGDYKNYEGYWSLKPSKRGVEVYIEADFDWGIPVLEKHVTKVLERKARLAFKSMLSALKKKLEKK